jgi:hypothetical protein
MEPRDSVNEVRSAGWVQRSRPRRLAGEWWFALFAVTVACVFAAVLVLVLFAGR